MRNRLQPIITMAKAGSMVANVQQMAVTIVLNNGTLHNTDGKDNQTIRFSRYQLQIPLKPPTRIDGDDVTQISKGMMSQQQLLTGAQQYGPGTKRGVRFLTEYHHRLVLPVGCFILSLLGLPLGLQAGPGRKAAGIPLGLGFFILYYVTFTLCRAMVEELTLPIVLGMWLPNIIFAVLTIIIFRRVERERPIFPEKLADFIANLKDKYISPLTQHLRKLFVRLVSRRRSAAEPKQRITAARQMLIHADSHSRTFHLPQCEHYECTSCTIEFNSVQVAQEAGFVPCRFCKTLIEKNKQ